MKTCYTDNVLKAGTQKAKDTDLLAHFTEWYCAAHHVHHNRSILVSDGVMAGIYGKRPPLLCAECAVFVSYAEKRTEHCPHDPKPFCTICDIKCYLPEMTEYSRNVMRYAGPRSLFSRYWYRALQHIFAKWRLRHNRRP